MDEEVDVVVIGAGITGLVTTFLLQEKGIRVLLLEKADRIGGQLHTLSDEGYLFESGPNTGVLSNCEVVKLFEKLHGDCSPQIAQQESKVRLIWKDGSFCPLPSNLSTALSTQLFSWHDKVNILFEPFREQGNDPFESIASLVKRRLGKSYLNYAVDPFISGVYAGDPDRLVTRFALPKLYMLEHEYGSFIRGSIKRHKALAEEKRQGISKAVFSVKGGFEQLVKAIGRQIPGDTIKTRTGKITTEPVAGGWLTTLTDQGKKIHSKYVITTVPAYALPAILPFITEKDMRPIASLDYAPIIQIGVGLKDGSLVPKAFGGLVPSIEKEKVLGILFNSSCYNDRAPSGAASLSFFFGGMKHQEMLDLSDQELYSLVTDALHRMLSYPKGTRPDKFHVFRHSKAIPQYEADSERRIKIVEELQRQYKGLILAGGLRDGIGLADRIKQATRLANIV
ncbi:MAG: protoporphyrinogen oxidase [Prevotella sp.]|jgi:oxygen-dependent protoporphyrinogen oxidase|nr:protoporphyrinogen oxidase [Prevotella sp.]MCI1685195.1 protoporphyrinogen oxidase [Prevotella sp.]MCI1782050.1 protoporphyrinogen oxidase [Prevotella sp.]MCI1802308.1 protoporphyrinogen oxidase [Prevotella sp.]MCI1817194.1 protoporphyrinogen oxidase [Prevotella sp.]MCI1847854.1 protoporphyrinogen oxidase [Prevotella sp.]